MTSVGRAVGHAFAISDSLAVPGAEAASRLPESSPADDSVPTASTATQTLPRPVHPRGRSDQDAEPPGGASPPRRYWPPHLRSSAANGSAPGTPTFMSPDWPVETSVTSTAACGCSCIPLAQPATIEQAKLSQAKQIS